MKILSNLTKLGLTSFLIGVSLLLSACGNSDEFKPSNEAEKKAVALIKEKYPDYKILSYELMAENYATTGKKLQQCLNNEKQVILFATEYHSNKKNRLLVTASAFIITTETNDIKKMRPELFVFEDYGKCFRASNLK